MLDSILSGSLLIFFVSKWTVLKWSRQQSTTWKVGVSVFLSSFSVCMGSRCFTSSLFLKFTFLWLCMFLTSFLSSFFFSSSPVHPMWQGPLAVPGGDRQSPIDIIVRKSVFDSALKPLVTDYDPETCQQIWNNGYSFLVEYDDTTDKSSE